MTPLTYTGVVQVYFNRHATDGRIWCVAAAGAECCVKQVLVRGCELVTKYAPQPVEEGPKRHDGPPSAWFEGDARLLIEGGVAHLFRANA